jgi:endonuclease YncB( thermonuclease family)
MPLSQRLLPALLLVDGDTIRVQQGPHHFTVRLACIDAPEMAQAPYGAQAADTCRAACGLPPP